MGEKAITILGTEGVKGKRCVCMCEMHSHLCNVTAERECVGGREGGGGGGGIIHCVMSELKGVKGAGIAQLVVLGLAVHSVAGSILFWGHFPVEGIFPLELTWVQTPFPQKLFQMRV